jgi:hypothetical protein
MQSIILSNTPNHQPGSLPGFEAIPLFARDLTPFGGEVGKGGNRALWALHRDANGRVTGREIVYGGPRHGYAFTPGGRKGLFRSTPGGCHPRLVLVDGPVQAIARAALDGADLAARTTYAAPGGPWTRAAHEALRALLLRGTGPELAVLAFGAARDGSCASAGPCQALLACHPAVKVEIQTPPQGGWLEALRTVRRASPAA